MDGHLEIQFFYSDSSFTTNHSGKMSIHMRSELKERKKLTFCTVISYNYGTRCELYRESFLPSD